jgi:hypothetical protein
VRYGNRWSAVGSAGTDERRDAQALHPDRVLVNDCGRTVLSEAETVLKAVGNDLRADERLSDHRPVGAAVGNRLAVPVTPTEKRFHQAMIQLYQDAKRETSYNASRFLQMVSEQGGLATAHRLLAGAQPSEGFTALWERGRLDLTVEHLVLQPEFATLFSRQERELAAERLAAYGG